MKNINHKSNISLLLIFITIWSSGFLLFSIQTRFFWIVDIVTLCLLGIIITETKNINLLSKNKYIFITLILIGSFCILPYQNLKSNINKGSHLFDAAKQLKLSNIKGNILADFKSNEDFSNIIILNYLNKSKFYGVYNNNHNEHDILYAIKVYSIDYYFYYYGSKMQKEIFLKSELCSASTFIYKDLIPGIVILSFTNQNNSITQ